MTMASQRRKSPARKRRTRPVKAADATPVVPRRLRMSPQRRARIDRIVATFDPHDGLGPAMYLGKKISRFRALTDHALFVQIHGRLISGMPAYRLARWVKEHTDADDPLGKMTLDSLARKLQRYARILPRSTFLPVTFLEELIKGAEADVIVLDELHAVLQYQKERLGLGRDIETKMAMPMEQQRREVETLMELLRQIRDTQIAFGLIPVSGPVLHILHGGGGSGPRLAENMLDSALSEHPEYLADTMSAMKLLEGMSLSGEPVRVEKNVTPEKEATDGPAAAQPDANAAE